MCLARGRGEMDTEGNCNMRITGDGNQRDLEQI